MLKFDGVKINLKDINEKLEPVEKYDEVPFSVEIWRKLFHLVSLSIPVIYTFVTREFALVVLSIITIIAIFIDLMIKKDNIVRVIIYKIFGKLFRKYERQNFVFNGATWMLISATLNVILFPKLATITSFYVLVISDACAALFGKRFGRTRFLNKSLEGFLAFILSGFVVVTLVWLGFGLPLAFLLSAYVGVILAGIVESSSAFLRIDDNLGVPLAISLSLVVGSAIAKANGLGFINLL
ncbi:dolichol kinase [Bacteroidetes/Chlorobi group bacterium Naka2016]|jgi:dolichol kinase|nr:MAG: dolichol kinase [Bacteroidetes/Chlorobi group bacterium Naka2016]